MILSTVSMKCGTQLFVAIGQHRAGPARIRLSSIVSAAGFLFCACGYFSDAPSTSGTVSGPVVVGYERFYRGSEAGADGGEILLSELGCVSCHEVEDETLAGIGRNQAPLLTDVGFRLNLDYLERFVADPPSVQPGTRMPGLFAEWSQAERNETVRDLASFLALQGDPFQDAGSPVASEESKRGEELYHSVGCVACHPAQQPPRLGYGDEDEAYRAVQIDTPEIEVPSVPLPNQRLKTALQPLADFLENPLKTRPSGRMPQMGLDPGEARAIASYLLDESGPGQGSEPRPPSPEWIDPGSGDRGRRLFFRLRCAACHQIGSSQKAVEPIPSSPALVQLDPDDPDGCLGGSPSRGVPDFDLSSPQKDALKAALRRLRNRDLSPLDPKAEVRRTLTVLNCFACHRRDGWGGPEAGRAAYFTSTQKIDLAEEGRIPPPLTEIGEKLTPKWLESVLQGSVQLRPYLATRMPFYGMENLGSLVENLGQADHDPNSPEVDVGGGQLHHRSHYGRRLMGVNAFNCVNCHDLLGQSSLGMPTLDLATSVERLQPAWFKKFMLDPESFRPRTLMPSFFEDGKSTISEVLGGDADKQIEAIWIYLKELDQTRLPEGMEEDGAFEITPQKRPVLLRTFMEGVGTHAIAVGYPEGIHAAFDALKVRFALAWRGRFLDAESTWADRYTPFTPALSPDQVDLGGGMPLARLQTPQSPWPQLTGSDADYRMGGYRIGADGTPVFFYFYQGIAIDDRMVPTKPDRNLLQVSQKLWLKRTLELRGRADSIWFRALSARRIEDRGDGVYAAEKLKIRLRSDGAESPTLRRSGSQMEVLLPLRFRRGLARIELELTW